MMTPEQRAEYIRWYRVNKSWKFRTRPQDIKRYEIKHAVQRRIYHRDYMRRWRAKQKQGIKNHDSVQ